MSPRSILEVYHGLKKDDYQLFPNSLSPAELYCLFVYFLSILCLPGGSRSLACHFQCEHPRAWPVASNMVDTQYTLVSRRESQQGTACLLCTEGNEASER